jgi:hypothetical protein
MNRVPIPRVPIAALVGSAGSILTLGGMGWLAWHSLYSGTSLICLLN